MPDPLSRLSKTERLRLMKFVCSFAWADLEIRPEERRFVGRMLDRLELDAEERRRVHGWLDVTPPPETVDPTQIPAEHRQLFVEAIEGVIVSDGEVAAEERENLELLQALLDGD